MADVFTKHKRSEVMARIRSRGNRDTELALAKLLRRHGITGWRRQVVVQVPAAKRRARRAEAERRRRRRVRQSRPTGIRPDFVFVKQRVAVFVDGCFWHGCPIHSPPARWLQNSEMPVTAGSCKAAKPRRTGKQFWRAKLATNKQRDRYVTRYLRRHGWRVVRIWEHDLANAPAKCIRKIRRALTGDPSWFPSSEARKR